VVPDDADAVSSTEAADGDTCSTTTISVGVVAVAAAPGLLSLLLERSVTTAMPVFTTGDFNFLPVVQNHESGGGGSGGSFSLLFFLMRSCAILAHQRIPGGTASNSTTIPLCQ